MRLAFSFLNLLQSANHPVQISLGFLFGMYLGFLPTLNLLWMILFFLLCILRINIFSALVSFLIFNLSSSILTPVFDFLGTYLLLKPSLQDIWTWSYHAPIIPFTHFYHTLVMGSFVFALILSPIVYLLIIFFVKHYLPTLANKFKETPAWNGWMGSRPYQLYAEYRRQNYDL